MQLLSYLIDKAEAERAEDAFQQTLMDAKRKHR